jgi:ribose 5-phosphate isomerase B
MKIAIWTDHHGYELGQEIIQILEKMNISYMYAGARNAEDTESNNVYVEYATQDVLDEKILAIIISGNWIGINMQANKVDGIRASLCSNFNQVRWGREDEDMNVLCIAAWEEEYLETSKLVKTFIETEYKK